MQVVQAQVFPFSRDVVWDRLMDFGVLARALPGIEKLEQLDDDTLKLSVKVAVPSITGSYEGTVRIVDRQPTESYKLSGEAKGRLGWVRGDAEFALATRDGGTEVSSIMDFKTGGVLSGVGQRFMQAIAKSMIRDFYSAFEGELSSSPPS